jgi:hypothetical protein
MKRSSAENMKVVPSVLKILRNVVKVHEVGYSHQMQ